MASPGSLFGSSSDKKQKTMRTINEDVLESQQNSSSKITRNADLKDLSSQKSPNKKSFGDISTLSNIMMDNRDLSGSSNYKYSGGKRLSSGKAKKTIKTDYNKLTKGLRSV